MARYIDADLLIETMQKRYDEICDTYGYHDLYASGYDDGVDAVENAPTADVVPKSEVAREIIDDIEMYVLGIKSGKEIIEKTTPRIYQLKRKDYMETVLEYLSELKKKYTGEQV